MNGHWSSRALQPWGMTWVLAALVLAAGCGEGQSNPTTAEVVADVVVDVQPDGPAPEVADGGVDVVPDLEPESEAGLLDGPADGAADLPPEIPADLASDDEIPAALTAQDCLQHTASAAECKDCCDCLPVDCLQAKECRDQCPLQDYSKNTEIIELEIPTGPGAQGDYSACTGLPTEQECKECCCADAIVCGDRKYCRNACAGSAQWPALDVTKLGKPVLIAATFEFTEGPAWDAQKNVLLFSDIDADTIYQLEMPDKVTVFRNPSHKANGLAFDPEGRLLAAEHASHSVTRTLADGSIATLADSYEGKPLNSPNDLAVRADGTIYFTDPTYGLGGQPSALGFTGLYHIAPDGTLFLDEAVEGAPNGVALSPDQATLYVAATDAGTVWAFPVKPSGELEAPALLANVDSPDGLAVDQGGNLYVAAVADGKGAVVILNALGKQLGTIPLDEAPTNCGFGGQEGKTLFITARKALYQLKAQIPGLI